VSSSQTCVIASSISLIEFDSRCFKIPFNIPKSQKSQGLISCEWGGCGNPETWCSSNFDATFELLWHATCPYIPTKSPSGSGHESSRFPFSNREKCNHQNIAGGICFLLVRCRARLVCVWQRKSLAWFASPRWPSASVDNDWLASEDFSLGILRTVLKMISEHVNRLFTD
jgi:hypothetical protein